MNRNIFNVLLTIVAFCLMECKSNTVVSPQGMVPNRKGLPYDAYGGYITIQTQQNTGYAGELLGIRNDSLVILSSNLIYIHKTEILNGRIIIYEPNSYRQGLLFAIPNLFLLGLIGNYGFAPVLTSVFFTGLNLGALGIAKTTEELKYNYIDWTGEGSEVLKYARFPNGIPTQLDLKLLSPRDLTATNPQNK